MSSIPCTSSGSKAASGVICNRPSRLRSVMLTTDGTNAATITLFDNASAASGTALAILKCAGATLFQQFDSGEGIEAQNGIYLSISGTGAAAVVTYQLE